MIEHRVFVAIAALSASMPVAAQHTPDIARVPVTGSRILSQQAQLYGDGPVTVIDSDAIARSGATSLEQLLQALPASAGTAGNQDSAYWTSTGFGAAQVNLRGLGINRTLVLINGRRVVAGGTGGATAVDLNMLPLAMIARVEVLRDGASAIYGADAVAGVVNVITKHPADTLSLTARYGATARGDGDAHAADLVWGQRGERGAFMASLNYAGSGTIHMATRAPCPLAEVAGALSCVGSSSTTGGRALLADGRRVNFNQDPNGNPRAFSTYSAATHGYNSMLLLNAVNPIQRLGATAIGNWQLDDATELFGEAILTERHSRQQATPGTLGQFRAIRINAAHPTNPTGQDLLLERRRVAEQGPRQFTQDNQTWRVVGGIKGRFSDKIDWTVALNWGSNRAVDEVSNVINLDRVDATLNAATCGKGGAPCGNYLGFGNLTPAVLDYIHTSTRDTGGYEQRSASGSVQGELFDLPAGTVRFATGAEWRSERGWKDPDPLIVSGIANTNAQVPLSGTYVARELFAELSLPLLQSLRLVNAGRLSDYSQSGSTHTYKAALDWQALSQLSVRAGKSSAFRAPSVAELFGGITQGALTTTDPCNKWNTRDPSSVIYQNCLASKVPAGFSQLSPTILTTGGGSRTLLPEVAHTTTAGLLWQPLAALTLTVDYYRIAIDNAIEAVPGSTKLSVCYNSPQLSHQFCQASSFTRDAQTGEINFLSSQPANAAQLRMAGVDFGALASTTVLGWKATLSANASRLDRYDTTPFAGGTPIQFAGKITGGRGSYAHWRSLSSLTLAQGPWSGSYAVQTIGSAQDINAAPTAIGAQVPAVAYHSASIKHAFASKLELSFGVENLFDRKAPYVASWIDANTDTMTYDLRGRRWQLRLAQQF
jgi:iron complex outermembrane receptor protein